MSFHNVVLQELPHDFISPSCGCPQVPGLPGPGTNWGRGFRQHESAIRSTIWREMNMTPKQFRDAMMAFRDEVGGQAYVSAGIANHYNSQGVLDFTLYPDGLCGSDKGRFTVYAEDWQSLIDAAKAKWVTYQEDHRKQSVRKIALAIIKATAELGQCTDAALRAEFSDDMIEKYGADAVVDANKIAANGPFEIVKLVGANGAPDDIVVRDPARLN